MKKIVAKNDRGLDPLDKSNNQMYSRELGRDKLENV